MKRLLFLATTFLISACTTLSTPKQTSIVDGAPLGNHYMTMKARQAQLMQIQNWSAQGSIAAQSNKQGWNANYSWQQQGRDYTLELFGPLGLNHIHLVGNPDNVTLLLSPQRSYSAKNPEDLLQQQTGWQLPVSNLYYWLRGLPSPNKCVHQSHDLNNHLVQLYQDGWHVTYLRYISVNGTDLPDRILLSNSAWHVRLFISKWQTN